MPSSKASFRDLYFGLASAEKEAAVDPERFRRTYYDLWNLSSRLDSREFFLIVGPKGSGKSAISEYTRLHLEEVHGEAKVFTATLNLDQVSPGLSPLSTISQKLVSDQATGTTDAAWRLYIALRFFELVMRDQSASTSSDPQAVKLAAELAAVGLLSSDFPTVLRRVRENKTAFSVKGLFTGETNTRSTDELPVTQLGEALLRIITTAASDSHYVLSIDGLDRIISENRAYWLTLAALLRVGDELHSRLMTSRADFRLFIMCRSDVFRRIIFADSDKIAGDAAIFVDWNANQTKPLDSPLWDYLSNKAGITVEQFFGYMPSHVPVGLRGKDRPNNIPIAEYLLQSTRSTPREMTMLMRRLQEQVPLSGYVTGERVRIAVDNFASRDLLTTVTAEATGLLHQTLGENLGEIISALPVAKGLTSDDVTGAVISARVDPALADELCEFLFLAGLLGNYDQPRATYNSITAETRTSSDEADRGTSTAA